LILILIFFKWQKSTFTPKRKRTKRRRSMDGIVGDSSPNLNTQTDWTPHVGIEFNIIEDA
jgi:hypothetical protein